ncbi:ribosome maturation factor RimM [Paludifilum halophilum]|uniref:Ribosome maturation factor RimM n=1 Tax=Paludifilum halophilum TaxID=1642702 RepID=A0A235B3H4_9BACL|nr:ribosome maturation factor RimM [Paludifilum halophilum]OYD06457.1 ribosome maturation factor RimM [Paludifilum halophilum]
MRKPDWLTVGHIAGTHGIRGGVRVIPRTDFPEVRFAPESQVFLSHPDHEEMLSLTVEDARPHKKGLLVRFQEWTDIDQVEPYKGGTLVVDPADRVEPEEEDAFYLYEIMGCEAVTTDGRTLGVVTDILQPGANDVWVVEKPEGGELLIPFIEDVVKEVDVSAKRVRIQWMEGLE